MTTVTAVTWLLCAEFVVAATEGKFALPEPPLHDHPTLVALVEKNNQCRAQYGLAKQPVSPRLTQLAQAHAEWMARTGQFVHNYEHGYPEIIYWNAESVESAFGGWMNSGPHRAIILNGSTHVGYGYAIGANGQTYWCGVFGNMSEEEGVRPVRGTLVSTTQR